MQPGAFDGGGGKIKLGRGKQISANSMWRRNAPFAALPLNMPLMLSRQNIYIYIYVLNIYVLT